MENIRQVLLNSGYTHEEISDMENIIRVVLNTERPYDILREMGFNIPLEMGEGVLPRQEEDLTPEEIECISRMEEEERISRMIGGVPPRQEEELTPEEMERISRMEEEVPHPPDLPNRPVFPPRQVSPPRPVSPPRLTTSVSSNYPPFQPPYNPPSSHFPRETIEERREMMEESDLAYAESAYLDSLKDLAKAKNKLEKEREELKEKRDKDREELNIQILNFVNEYQDCIFETIRGTTGGIEKEIKERESELKRLLRIPVGLLSPDDRKRKQQLDEELACLRKRLEEAKSNHCVNIETIPAYYTKGEFFKFYIPPIPVPFCVLISLVVESGDDPYTSLYNVDREIVNVPITIDANDKYIDITYPLSPEDTKRFFEQAEEAGVNLRQHPQMTNSLIDNIRKSEMEVRRLTDLVSDNKKKRDKLRFY